MATYAVHGYVESGYEPIRQLFEKNFAKGIEDNAQLCVYEEERVVVNLWGTSNLRKVYRTEKRAIPYDDNTLACVFSCSKVLSAICMATLVEKGLLSYSDKVVKHWPEYGNDDREKMSMTVANILRHEGGMHKLSTTLSLLDIQMENIKKNSIGKLIEKEALRFPPDEAETKTQYHVYTIGFILNEIFRRVDPQGRTIGECLRQDISDPLNASAYIGLTFEELHNSVSMSMLSPRQVLRGSCIPKCMGRKVQCSLGDVLNRMKTLSRMKRMNHNSIPALENVAFPSTTFQMTGYLLSPAKTGEIPSTNAQASAQGLAKIAAMMANKGEFDGIRYFSESTWDLLHSDFEARPMFPHYGTTNFSSGGVNLFDTVDSPIEFFKANEYRKGFVGWIGLGGSAMQWHPMHKIGFAYVPTMVSWEDAANTKAALLQQKVVDCLTEIKKRKCSPIAETNLAFTRE